MKKRKQAKPKTRNVLTVWSPFDCPDDTGGDYTNIHPAAVTAVCLAVRKQTTMTVSLDTLTLDNMGQEIKRDGVTALKINGKKFLTSGIAANSRNRPKGRSGQDGNLAADEISRNRNHF